MFHPLPFTQRFTPYLTLACLVFSVFSPVALCKPLDSETLLASHGGEGGGASVISGTSAAPVVATVQGQAVKSVMSTSLWGNMLLSMAYPMDPELQRLVSKMGRVNALTLLSITGVSGLGLAQSVYALNQNKPQHLDVEEHGGDHGTVTVPADSRVPATLGIVGSGVTLATLGLNAVLSKHYSRKLTQRQLIIKEKVDRILIQLKAQETNAQTRQDLVTLVGEEATDEFLQLWQATHP